MRFRPTTKEELKEAVTKYIENKDIEKYGEMNSWDVSLITDMSKLFSGFRQFNEPIDKWDVSNVTNMRMMFKRCRKFNQSLEAWDVSNVTDMCMMFSCCKKFNRPLGNWNVSNVTDMCGMFNKCSSFNQDLASWDVSKVKLMQCMFCECISFNSSLNAWDVSNINVNDMAQMFEGCKRNFLIMHEVKETIVVDKKEKCIICLEETETYNKLCDKDIKNDHYYCDGCFDFSQMNECLICKTKPYHIKYVMN